MESAEIAHALGKSQFFRGLDPGDIEKVVGVCRPVTYHRGEYICQQGEPGENLYIIVDGQIFLERTFDLGDRKGRVIIETLGKGNVFGCWSTLLDESHTMMSTATCQKPSIILVLRGEDLRSLMLENKAFGFNVMERFCLLLRDRIQAAYGALEKM